MAHVLSVRSQARTEPTRFSELSGGVRLCRWLGGAPGFIENCWIAWLLITTGQPAICDLVDVGGTVVSQRAVSCEPMSSQDDGVRFVRKHILDVFGERTTCDAHRFAGEVINASFA